MATLVRTLALEMQFASELQKVRVAELLTLVKLVGTRKVDSDLGRLLQYTSYTHHIDYEGCLGTLTRWRGVGPAAAIPAVLKQAQLRIDQVLDSVLVVS